MKQSEELYLAENAVQLGTQDAEFIPYTIQEIELSQPIPALSAPNQRRILLHIRLHGVPIGRIELQPFEKELTTEQVAGLIWQKLSKEINNHLFLDHLSERTELNSMGLTAEVQPGCLRDRTKVLANAPKVSVLVATHNRPSVLAKCLNSLLSMDYPDFEIIVVDNAPADRATEDLIKRNYTGAQNIRYVREIFPGLARAHNRGLEVVQTKYVAITDDDVLVDRYWLVEIVKAFMQDSNIGCVTGTIFPAEIQTRSQYWMEHAAGFTKGYVPRIYNLQDHRPDHPLFPYAAGMFGSGANMAFDTSILRKMGGFDDSLGAGSIALGGDDLASFFQVITRGFTLIYEPGAIVYHRHYREYAHLQRSAYGYGAGLTAFIMKTVVDRPVRLFDLARRIPYGLYYALNARSPKNSRKAADYPRELNWIERKGMAAGPILYFRSRWNTRKFRNHTRFAQAQQSWTSSEKKGG